jgi:hypothetical protein
VTILAGPLEKEDLMSGTAIAGAVVVIAVIVLVISVMAAARRRGLQQRFGQEYERVVADRQSRRKAEAELARRERHVQQLNIRPLAPAARASYAAQWADIQQQFVDQPQHAAAEAQRLLVAVLNERGYPAESHDQIAADLSVQHPAVLDRYRAAETISRHAAAGDASTEELRQAMIDYRALIGELLVQTDTAGSAAGAMPPSESAAEPADLR